MCVSVYINLTCILTKTGSEHAYELFCGVLSSEDNISWRPSLRQHNSTSLVSPYFVVQISHHFVTPTPCRKLFPFLHSYHQCCGIRLCECIFFVLCSVISLRRIPRRGIIRSRHIHFLEKEGGLAHEWIPFPSGKVILIYILIPGMCGSFFPSNTPELLFLCSAYLIGGEKHLIILLCISLIVSLKRLFFNRLSYFFFFYFSIWILCTTF